MASMLGRGKLMCSFCVLQLCLCRTAEHTGTHIKLMPIIVSDTVTCKGTQECGEMQATQCADIYHQVHARKSGLSDSQWHAP